MIVIIGGGISGLTLAWQLQKLCKPYRLLEGSSRFGGHIQTKVENGFRMDTGPNTLLADDVVWNFVKELGLESEVLFPNPVANKRFIFRNGRFHGLSPNPITLLTTKLLSWKSKRNIWKERSVLAETIVNETLAGFTRRRFDSELLDWVISPIQSGIYAGDPEELILADAFPKMAQWEQEHGSVVKGMMKSAGGTRAKTLNFTTGMEALPKQIASQLNQARSASPVQSVQLQDDKWKVEWIEKGTLEQVLADQVVCCIPTYKAAELFNDFSALAQGLHQVEYTDMAMVHTAVNKQDTAFQFGGFGGLIPSKAGFASSGSIWASSVFENRAPSKMHLIAQFMGGALRPEIATYSNSTALVILNQENELLYGIKCPDYQQITRWKKGIPRYDLKRKLAVDVIEKATPPGLHFLSNWKSGIGLSDCIRNAVALSSQL